MSARPPERPRPPPPSRAARSPRRSPSRAGAGWRWPVGPGLLTLAATLALGLGLAVRQIGWPGAGAPAADPALVRANLWQSRAFGDIDRWAVPGMSMERAREALEAHGYQCRKPRDPYTGREIRDAEGEFLHLCAKAGAGLLGEPALVVMRARHQTQYEPQLLSALAGTGGEDHTPEPRSARGAAARALLEWTGVRTPRALQVSGWHARGPDDLAALLQDRLLPPPDWPYCDAPSCVPAYARRFFAGLPVRAAGQPLPQAHACQWASVLQRLGLRAVTPVPARDARAWHQIPLLELQADRRSAVQRFAGSDLRGQPWRVALALRPDGMVQTIELQVGTQTQRYASAGGPPVAPEAFGCSNEAALTWLPLAQPITSVVAVDLPAGAPPVPQHAAWLLWMPDDTVRSAFEYNLPLWAALDEPARERLLVRALSQPDRTRGHADGPWPALTQGLGAVGRLAEQPAAWPAFEMLERLAADPQVVQKGDVLALALMRCGARDAWYRSDAPPPDRACWQQLQARAPRLADATRQLVQAQRQATGWQPRYNAEKQLWRWLQALLDDTPPPPASAPAPAAPSPGADHAGAQAYTPFAIEE